MIGDVIGHDIGAAAVMGQLRSILRMGSWMSSGAPSHDLQRLDPSMRDLGLETIASAVLARVEAIEVVGRATWQLRWSSAGHLPPLLVDPDGTARFLDSSTGTSPLLGVAPETVRHDDDVRLVAGSLLLLCTDGLVERRVSPSTPVWPACASWPPGLRSAMSAMSTPSSTGSSPSWEGTSSRTTWPSWP